MSQISHSAVGIIFLAALVSLSLAPAVSSLATGQCYAIKPTYMYNEIVTVVIKTSTGINDTRIQVLLPYGQINTFFIGKVGAGIWQYQIGPAGPPEGQRTLVLLDGSTVLYTSYYMVAQAYPAPVTITAVTTTTTSKTSTRYQTVTASTTLTRSSTITRVTTTSETTVRYLTSTRFTTVTQPSTVTHLQTVRSTEVVTHIAISTLALPLPTLPSSTLIYGLLAIIVLLVFAVLFAIAKMAKK